MKLSLQGYEGTDIFFSFPEVKFANTFLCVHAAVSFFQQVHLFMRTKSGIQVAGGYCDGIPNFNTKV